MKKYVFFSFLLLATFHFTNFTDSTSAAVIKQVEQQFTVGLKQFQKAIDQYAEVATDFDNQSIARVNALLE